MFLHPFGHPTSDHGDDEKARRLDPGLALFKRSDAAHTTEPSKKAELSLRFFGEETLLNRCIRLANRETVCVI
jgi:hypothetical protein